MKRLGFATFCAIAAAMPAFASPATAGSIELVDGIVTGEAGGPVSMLKLEAMKDCTEDYCTVKSDATAMTTQATDATALRPINVSFARKFPDPAVTSQTPVSPDQPMMANMGAGDMLSAPADVGMVPPQAPVGDETAAETAPATDGTVPAETATAAPDTVGDDMNLRTGS